MSEGVGKFILAAGIAAVVAIYLAVSGWLPYDVEAEDIALRINEDDYWDIEESMNDMFLAIEEAKSLAYDIEWTVYDLEERYPESESVKEISSDVYALEKQLDEIEDQYDTIWDLLSK